MASLKLSMNKTIKLIRLHIEKECMWQSDSIQYRKKAARDMMNVEDIKIKYCYCIY